MLAVILGYTELALAALPPDSLPGHHLRPVLAAGERARGLVQQILTFSRQTTPAPQPLQLHLLVQDALALVRATLPTTIALQAHLDDQAGAVLADPTQMQQVLLNLCTNAAHAMRETGGVLEVRVEAGDGPAAPALGPGPLLPGPSLRLTVRDTGHGMTPDILEHIFEPFFTTKGVGEGTGLGLAVVHGIITSHRGAMTVASTPGEGTTVVVDLPRLAAGAPRGAPHPVAALPGGTERILFVDDEASLAAMGQAMLVELGYEVVACVSSLEALETFRAAPHSFALVITDYTMPVLTGEALARALRAIRPDVPIILCSGLSTTSAAEYAQALGVNVFLMKPWQLSDLACTIRQVLGQGSA
jgi:CheY-like chemotaxis protein